ncbi:hypothetical protein ACOMHN_024620 [Nucella lapillus]
MRVRCSKSVIFKCRPCLALLALLSGLTTTGLLLWTEVKLLIPFPSLLSSSLSQQLSLGSLEAPWGRQGSSKGTPCLLTRLYDIDCHQLSIINTTYLSEIAHRTWKDSAQCHQKPLPQLVQDCDALKMHHGYHRWPLTPQEKDFPLAFGLKIHHAPDMFARLLRVLWRPHNFYCIHVDSKTSTEVYDLIRNVTDCFDNVVMAQTRIDLVYLSIASLLSDMECMRAALRSKVSWKYYLNLSGQEFPLKTNLELVQILTRLGGKNDVESYLPTKYVSSWFNFKYIIINGSLKPTKIPKDPFMYPVQIRKGSAYGAFSREFLIFSMESQLAREFLHWLTDTMAPDEIFWATLNHLPGVPGSVRYPISHRYNTVLSRAIVWQWDSYKCRFYVRGVCIFTASDLHWLSNRPELIANKFNESVDPVVLDCLETALEDRSVLAFKRVRSLPPEQKLVPLPHLNWKFYSGLPHLKTS